MIDFGILTLASGIQRNIIQETHKDNIVFRWLKRPCKIFCSPEGVLTQEDLFYLCLQFLDILKDNDPSDCILQDELQCIPYTIEKLLAVDKYKYYYQCANERLLVLVTLYTLTRMTNCTYSEELSQCVVCDMKNIIPSEIYEGYWRKRHYENIENILTRESTIFRHSADIMSGSNYYDRNSIHLIGYIQNYMESPKHVSKEIAAQIIPKTSCPDTLPSKNNDTISSALQNTLKEELLKKDKEIAELKANLKTCMYPAAGYIKINSTYKSKVAALLSAMFYANYFHGEGELSNRNQVVSHILHYGFNYTTNSIQQLLHAFTTTGSGTNFEDIKNDLRETIENQLKDALNDLKKIGKN